MKIKEALSYGINELNKKNIEESNLKIRLLLSSVLGENKEYLITHDEEMLDRKKEKEFLNGIKKLKGHVPIQYITNIQEFMGYKFYVDESVLIPQPDTETLVEEVIDISNKIIKNTNRGIRVLDLCAGSGAIGISLSKILGERASLTLSDIDQKALNVIHINSVRYLANVGIVQSDLFDNIYGKFDIIVSNPPYIETKTISKLPLEVQKEPKIALDGGKDGLEFYKKIAQKAKDFLNPSGYLALEIGYNQKEKVEELLKKHSYKNIYSKKDLSENDRVIIAQNNIERNI